MHNDTYNLLRRAVDSLRAQVNDMLPAAAFDRALALAQAESLLAAHEAQTAPLPSRWATVHPVDNASTTGTIKAIPGGYRLYWHDTDVAAESEVPEVRARDIFAVHSIDWLTEEQHTAHVEEAAKTYRERAKEHYRRTHWPEGYRLVIRTGNYAHRFGLQRLFDGLVAGFWSDCGEPLSEAWECYDDGSLKKGRPGDIARRPRAGKRPEFKPSAYPVEPCADMPLPF